MQGNLHILKLALDEVGAFSQADTDANAFQKLFNLFETEGGLNVQFVHQISPGNPVTMMIMNSNGSLDHQQRPIVVPMNRYCTGFSLEEEGSLLPRKESQAMKQIILTSYMADPREEDGECPMQMHREALEEICGLIRERHHGAAVSLKVGEVENLLNSLPYRTHLIRLQKAYKPSNQVIVVPYCDLHVYETLGEISRVQVKMGKSRNFGVRRDQVEPASDFLDFLQR